MNHPGSYTSDNGHTGLCLYSRLKRARSSVTTARVILVRARLLPVPRPSILIEAMQLEELFWHDASPREAIIATRLFFWSVILLFLLLK